MTMFDHSSLRTIVAEDNPVNAKVLETLLKQMGIEAEIATDGLDLLERMQGDTFDLVLTDISMPRMDGYDATLRIRDGAAGAHHTDIPIVAVTALGEPESYQTCRDVGMNGFLTKPIRKANLQQVIEAALQRQPLQPLES